VERGAEGFARSLEKAQEAGKAHRLKSGEGPDEAVAKQGKKAPTDLSKTLEEALGGLNEQQLIRVLMQISPKELLRYAESLGLDTAALLSPADASGSAWAEGKLQLNRDRLVRLIAALSELLGGQTVLDAISATGGKKRLGIPHSPEPDAAGKVKSQELGEARDTGKKPRVVVLDLRRDQPGVKEGQEQPNSMKNSFTLTMEKTVEAQERDVSVLFRAPFQDRAQVPTLEASVRTARVTTNFEQRFIPEVVKQTGIILKEGGNGEIRLVLKPENLGSIRIRLALSESSLEGRIVVDNNSVKELVESSLDNLKNALRLEGYQTNLELSVGHRRSRSGSEQAQTQPTGWLANGSEEFDKAIPLYLDMKPDYELVNVFA
jgi:flagellar hook-length control protein FliK